LSLEVAKSEEVTEHAVLPTDEHGHEEHLYHQFENRAQQDESYVVGMWTFLVTEILFFGALFLVYALFRMKYPQVYSDAHEHLDWRLGALNTVVLLTSSLTMAMAVYEAQIGKRWRSIGYMLVTMFLAAAFLVIKLAFEWYPKWQHHLVPGPSFHYFSLTPDGREIAPLVAPGKAELFFGLYFTLTGLHGIHVLIGILVMGVLCILLALNRPSVRYYMPIELAGLYWHFVDIVWIFLFPLFYLIGR
jgi:cytochrome c oxidase subunit 3